MMLFEIPQHPFEGCHYVELVCTKRVIPTTERLVGDVIWHTMISDLLLFLVTKSNHEWITKSAPIGFSDAAWSIVLNTCVVTLIAQNAFQLDKRLSTCLW